MLEVPLCCDMDVGIIGSPTVAGKHAAADSCTSYGPGTVVSCTQWIRICPRGSWAPNGKRTAESRNDGFDSRRGVPSPMRSPCLAIVTTGRTNNISSTLINRSCLLVLVPPPGA